MYYHSGNLQIEGTKVFYHKDIRNYGSKNLGGGNAGRVLGEKAGLVVMILDIMKVTLVIFLNTFFFNVEMVSIIGGLAAAIGHCFPICAKFKGGKAVAVMYGFLRKEENKITWMD